MTPTTATILLACLAIAVAVTAYRAVTTLLTSARRPRNVNARHRAGRWVA